MTSQLTTEKIIYRFPKQHLYNGIVMNGLHPASALDAAKRTQFFHDDVIVATYPKSGNTWMTEIIWLLLNNLDYNAATSEYVEDRCPFLEYVHSNPELYDRFLKETPPRTIKTHFYYEALENAISASNPKVIVVMRNPKDVLVSFYHHYQRNKYLGCFNGTWDQFFELFKNDELHFGVWKDHVLGWWTNKGKPNYHFVKYEDLKKHPSKVITGISNFLGVKLSDEALDKLVHHTSFDVMKNNKMANRDTWPAYDTSISKFMRKGEVGDWKNYFTDEQNYFMNEIIEEISRKGLTFDFD